MKPTTPNSGVRDLKQRVHHCCLKLIGRHDPLEMFDHPYWQHIR